MILITGASGNVGREVVKQALAVGLEIRRCLPVARRSSQSPCGIGRRDHGLRETRDNSSSIGGGGKDSSGGTASSGNCPRGKRISSRRCARLGGSTLSSFPLWADGSRCLRADIASRKRI